MNTFSCYDVRKGTEAGVADWNSDGVVAFLLQELYKYCFAVEASLAPTAKSYSVDFFTQTALFPRAFNALSALKE